MSSRVIRLALLSAALTGASALGWSRGGATAPEATPGKRPITFEDLEQMKRVSDPQVSPSGKWVLFSATEVGLDHNSMVNHLWVVPLGGAATSEISGTRERQITFTRDGEFGGRLSPDGKTFLYAAHDEETGRLQIFVAPWEERTGKPGIPKRLTNLATGADGALWSPDSQRILFGSSVYPECSDEATWTAEDTCDKAKDKSRGANLKSGQTSNGESKRSHMLVVFASNGSAIRDLTPRRSIGDADVRAFSPDGRMDYAWAADSMEVAFVANSNRLSNARAKSEVFILKLNKAGALPEKVSNSVGSDDEPAYSPDGKWLAFRSQTRLGSHEQFRLVLFDRQAGVATEPLPKFDRGINEFTWAPDSASIFFAAYDRGETYVYSVAVADENTIHYIAVPTGHLTLLFTSGSKSEFNELQISSDGTWLVSTAMSVERPPEVFRIDLRTLADDGAEIKEERIGLKLALAADKAAPPVDGAVTVSPEALTHLNDKLLVGVALERLEPFWFAGADGTKVQGFMVRPPGFDPSRRYPVKFLIHEDLDEAWGDAWSYRRNLELMTASGYVVVMVNPRGSIGYGQAFIDGVKGDSGGKAYVDLMKGLDYAEQHYGFLDKTRECALSDNFSGLMANWILTHTDRFACIVTHDGIFDPESAYETTSEQRAEGEESSGRDSKRVQDQSTAHGSSSKWSPVLSTRDARTPTLVVRSQQDDQLDVSEPLQLVKTLQQLNVQSKMLYLPDEGHRIDQSQNSKLWYESVGDWCDRWTKTNRYATGSPQYARTATVAEPTNTQVKPQPVPAPTRSEAQTLPEPPQPTSSPLRVRTAVATTAPTVQPAVAPAQSTSEQSKITPPPATTQSSAHVVPPPSTSNRVAPLVIPNLPAEIKTQLKPQAQNLTVPRVVPTTPPTAISQQAPQTVTQPNQHVASAPLAPASQNISQGTFAITISMPVDELKIGEDARLVISLTNVSTHPILFSHPPGTDSAEFSFIFLVRNSAGNLMGENIIATGPGISDLRAVDHIPPGGTVVETAHLSRLVHLSQPGRYTVRVYRRDVDNNYVVQSNEVTLNVVPSSRAR